MLKAAFGKVAIKNKAGLKMACVNVPVNGIKQRPPLVGEVSANFCG
jgi:hypothetical protein